MIPSDLILDFQVPKNGSQMPTIEQSLQSTSSGQKMSHTGQNRPQLAQNGLSDAKIQTSEAQIDSQMLKLNS